MNAHADHLAFLVVTALCASILVLAEALHRYFTLEPEWTRKLVHVLMGLTATAFPWLFHDGRSVALLCALFAAILGASLAFSRLPSVHGVGRRTGGVLWFPLGVASVFAAAGGRADLYATAILVLTLADPAAAMVGRARGTHRLRLGPGTRTLEGSCAFFLVACECLFLALVLTTAHPAADSFARAMGIAALLTAVELVSPAGSDNFFVPTAALVLLRATASGGMEQVHV